MAVSVHLRIDERLLHAEVLYGWLPTLQPDRIVVAAEAQWHDLVDLTVVRESTVVLVEPEKVPGLLRRSENVLVVFRTLADLKSAISHGLEPNRLVLGNRGQRDDTRRVSESFFVDEQEFLFLRQLITSGVEVVTQSVPSKSSTTLHLENFDVLSKTSGCCQSKPQGVEEIADS